MRLVMLAHPTHPRVASMQAALAGRGLPQAVVVGYRDWLTAPVKLLTQLDEPCWLKLEAPGEEAAVQDALIARGALVGGHRVPPPLTRGEVAHGALWYAGFADALRNLDAELRTRPWVRCLNPPATILDMCDKLTCQQRLHRHGISIPTLAGPVTSFDALCHWMNAHAMHRMFVKPRYGSSASGVVAVQTDGRGRFVATTSVEMTHDPSRLFNSLRVRRYHDAAVAQLIDRLAPNELYAEAWIAKPRWGAMRFDIRTVALAGQPAHRVARLSAHPLTNLHLGNQRGRAEDRLNAAATARMEETVRLAMTCFPHGMVAGIDIIVGEQQCHVLEVNAFGDWLPGLTWQGQSVHAAQVAMLDGNPTHPASAGFSH